MTAGEYCIDLAANIFAITVHQAAECASAMVSQGMTYLRRLTDASDSQVSIKIWYQQAPVLW